MNPIFADTFYWVALSNRRDTAFVRVADYAQKISGRFIVTTDEVLTELLTFRSGDPQLRADALNIVDGLFRSTNVLIIPQTRESFLSGLELYRARPDKQYSLTDCISMQTMRREGILEVLTNDRHFQQEGFRAIFRDL